MTRAPTGTTSAEFVWPGKQIEVDRVVLLPRVRWGGRRCPGPRPERRRRACRGVSVVRPV